MTVLSAQSIRAIDPYIVTPFRSRSIFEPLRMSYGLSSCGYDVRLKEGHPGMAPGTFFLGSTLEYFQMPDKVVGVVHDKSTWGRKGLAVQNTVIEPGWYGHLTLEITNHGPNFVALPPGCPIAQILFHWLDEATEQPYAGKYQGQEDRPVPALREDGKPL